MSKSLGLLRRLFGTPEPTSSNAATDQQIGEAALLDLLVPGRKGFVEGMIRSLKSSEGWPFDLGEGTLNPSEWTILNLWGFTLAVRNCFPDISGDEKTEFLTRVHTWFLSRSVLSEALVETSVEECRALRDLAAIRFREYNFAWKEMQPQQVPGKFPQLILENLFGRESNSMSVSVKITLEVPIYVNSFATSFGTPRGWQAMRTIIDRAAVSKTATL